MSFTRYPDYKDSGVDWLGQLPSHWDVVQFKQLIDIQNGTDHKHVEHSEGYPVIGSGGAFAYASDYLYDGESVLLGRKGTIDKPLYINGRFWTVDTMYWTKINPLASGRFAYYSALNLPFDYYSTKTALPSMTKAALSSHLIGRPQLEEQKSIANFLDQETTKIDALVAEQQKLIELLKEKRQAVISHAVTKGLDPTVKMKNSGAEWLVKVPEHWYVKKLKFVVDVMASNVDKKTYDGDIPCLLCNYTDVYYNEAIKEDMEFMSATATPEQIKKFTLKQGDVIITKDSESPDDIAIAAYVPMDLIGVVCGYHLSIIRATEINGLFVKRLFDSHYLKSKFATLANGLTRYGLGQHSINNVCIPIPPDEEQQQIVKFINKTCVEIDDLIDKSKTSINLLTERRSALISAAVTGQIDVRNSYGS
jgi:type I restriction enzyme S subunit